MMSADVVPAGSGWVAPTSLGSFFNISTGAPTFTDTQRNPHQVGGATIHASVASCAPEVKVASTALGLNASKTQFWSAFNVEMPCTKTYIPSGWTEDVFREVRGGCENRSCVNNKRNASSTETYTCTACQGESTLVGNVCAWTSTHTRDKCMAMMETGGETCPPFPGTRIGKISGPFDQDMRAYSTDPACTSGGGPWNVATRHFCGKMQCMIPLDSFKSDIDLYLAGHLAVDAGDWGGASKVLMPQAQTYCFAKETTTPASLTPTQSVLWYKITYANFTPTGGGTYSTTSIVPGSTQVFYAPTKPIPSIVLTADMIPDMEEFAPDLSKMVNERGEKVSFPSSSISGPSCIIGSAIAGKYLVGGPREDGKTSSAVECYFRSEPNFAYVTRISPCLKGQAAYMAIIRPASEAEFTGAGWGNLGFLDIDLVPPSGRSDFEYWTVRDGEGVRPTNFSLLWTPASKGEGTTFSLAPSHATGVKFRGRDRNPALPHGGAPIFTAPRFLTRHACNSTITREEGEHLPPSLEAAPSWTQWPNDDLRDQIGEGMKMFCQRHPMAPQCDCIMPKSGDSTRFGEDEYLPTASHPDIVEEDKGWDYCRTNPDVPWCDDADVESYKESDFSEEAKESCIKTDGTLSYACMARFDARKPFFDIVQNTSGEGGKNCVWPACKLGLVAQNPDPSTGHAFNPTPFGTREGGACPSVCKQVGLAIGFDGGMGARTISQNLVDQACNLSQENVTDADLQSQGKSTAAKTSVEVVAEAAKDTFNLILDNKWWVVASGGALMVLVVIIAVGIMMLRIHIGKQRAKNALIDVATTSAKLNAAEKKEEAIE